MEVFSIKWSHDFVDMGKSFQLFFQEQPVLPDTFKEENNFSLTQGPGRENLQPEWMKLSKEQSDENGGL